MFKQLLGEGVAWGDYRTSCYEASHVVVKTLSNTMVLCMLSFDSMTVSCSTNLAVGTPCTCQMQGPWRSAYIISTACASLFDDVWWIGWMDGGRAEREEESEVGCPESTCGFKSANCKIGCRNGRGNGQGRPTAPMALAVVIGCFYYWWLLVGVLRSWGKSDGPVDTARETRPRSCMCGKACFVSPTVSPLLEPTLPPPFLSSPLPSSPLLSSSLSLSLFLPPRFLLRGILTPSFFPLLCVNCYFF